jgi:hypothetical protein
LISILQTEKECFVCKATYGLEEHHCIYGSANRKQSELHGLKVWLCAEHHRGNSGVHFNRELDLSIKRFAQTEFEKTHTREDFIRIFGKSYLG